MASKSLQDLVREQTALEEEALVKWKEKPTKTAEKLPEITTAQSQPTIQSQCPPIEEIDDDGSDDSEEDVVEMKDNSGPGVEAIRAQERDVVGAGSSSDNKCGSNNNTMHGNHDNKSSSSSNQQMSSGASSMSDDSSKDINTVSSNINADNDQNNNNRIDNNSNSIINSSNDIDNTNTNTNDVETVAYPAITPTRKALREFTNQLQPRKHQITNDAGDNGNNDTSMQLSTTTSEFLEEAVIKKAGKILVNIDENSMDDHGKMKLAQNYLKMADVVQKRRHRKQQRQETERHHVMTEQQKEKAHNERLQLELSLQDEKLLYNLLFFTLLIAGAVWLFSLSHFRTNIMSQVLQSWVALLHNIIESLNVAAGLTIKGRHVSTSQTLTGWLSRPWFGLQELLYHVFGFIAVLVILIVLVIILLQSPRVGIATVVLTVFSVFWKSMLHLLVWLSPVFIIQYFAVSCLTNYFTKISQGRLMYKLALCVLSIGCAVSFGVQAARSDPLNPVRQSTWVDQLIEVFVSSQHKK